MYHYKEQFHFMPVTKEMSIKIKPEVLDDLKFVIISKLQRDFIEYNKKEIENANVMTQICPEESKYLIGQLKQKYKPCDLDTNSTWKVVFRPESNLAQTLIVKVSIEWHYNDVYILSGVVYEDEKDNVFPICFEDEYINEIKLMCSEIRNNAEAKLNEWNTKNEFKEALQEVKPDTLKNKLKGLVDKLC